MGTLSAAGSASSKSIKSQGAKSKREPQGPRKTFIAGLVAGAMFVIACIGYTASSLGSQLSNYYPQISEAAKPVLKWWYGDQSATKISSAALPANSLPERFYVTMFWKGEEDPAQTFSFHLSASDKLSGEGYTDRGVPLKVSVFNTAHYAIVRYESAIEGRPGFGHFYLRKILNPNGGAVRYEGKAIVHECECGDKVINDGPIVSVPAILHTKTAIDPLIKDAISQIDKSIFLEPK